MMHARMKGRGAGPRKELLAAWVQWFGLLRDLGLRISEELAGREELL